MCRRPGAPGLAGGGHIEGAAVRGVVDRDHLLALGIDRRGVNDSSTAVIAHQFARFHGHEEIAADIYFDRFVIRTEVGIEHVAKVGVGGSIVHADTAGGGQETACARDIVDVTGIALVKADNAQRSIG